MIQDLRERFRRKHAAYSRTFCDANGKLHPNALTVLGDLEKFSGMHKGGIVVSPVSRVTDPYATAYRAGMRDVVLRIKKFLGPEAAKILEAHANDD